MFASTLRLRTLILSGLAFAVSVPALNAQDEKPDPPEGWVVRTDGGHGAEEIEFVDMPPGMHITTGPAAIFYDPARTASGEYTIESEVFLFDPGRRNEAFGIFIGGQDLDADSRAYTYFLIKRDGSVLVKRRDGGDTSTLLGWTKSDAVVTWEERGEEGPTAKNVLGARVSGGQLTFSVNGVEVFSTSAEDQHVDGVVGFRVNHGLNLHFTSLEVHSG
ncbi:MAG: hypothetical protein ACC682_08165 [Gemmatimonadota bacterium]